MILNVFFHYIVSFFIYTDFWDWDSCYFWTIVVCIYAKVIQSISNFLCNKRCPLLWKYMFIGWTLWKTKSNKNFKVLKFRKKRVTNQKIDVLNHLIKKSLWDQNLNQNQTKKSTSINIFQFSIKINTWQKTNTSIKMDMTWWTQLIILSCPKWSMCYFCLLKAISHFLLNFSHKKKFCCCSVCLLLLLLLLIIVWFKLSCIT